MSDKSQEVFTPEQAADYLQVNRETIYRYIRDGKLVASKLGRTYRVPRRSLELLLWATRTREDITLREYTGEEIAEFTEADRLDEEDASSKDDKEQSGSEFLLSIAGMLSSGTTDTSENIEPYVAKAIKKKYS